MSALDLAVVIVTWNVRDLIADALRTLITDLAQSGLQYQVYVVDSGSSDGTAQHVAALFPQVTLTASPENLGFGRANNLAMRQMGFENPAIPTERLPKAVYLLNPDTLTQRGASRALYDALFSAADIGWVGANLTYADGSFQHGAFHFPGLRQLYAEFFPLPARLYNSGFNGRYPLRRYAGEQPFTVDFTLGATMMLRREVILQTGMFDEAFFVYCEEVDWGWRVQRAGWRALCVPSAHVVHLGGQSTSQVSAKSVVYLWESRLKLYAKHYPRWKLKIAHGLVRAGIRSKLRHVPANRPDLTAAYQHILAITV
ncbi:MAG: glycosyltransferase family 2 protein [Phototrophicaceae bacterium]